MAKYEIKREQLKDGDQEERRIVNFSSVPFRDEWIHMVSGVIAENFRCRCIAVSRVGSGGAFRIRFYGYEEDAIQPPFPGFSRFYLSIESLSRPFPGT